VYGLIHRLVTHPGQRDAFIGLVRDHGAAPGCLSLVLAHDPAHPDGVWITEVWPSEDAYRATLAREDVQATVAATRRLVASFDAATTRPVVVLP
jgi:quinol monooxygenase YgiN